MFYYALYCIGFVSDKHIVIYRLSALEDLVLYWSFINEKTLLFIYSSYYIDDKKHASGYDVLNTMV